MSDLFLNEEEDTTNMGYFNEISSLREEYKGSKILEKRMAQLEKEYKGHRTVKGKSFLAHR